MKNLSLIIIYLFFIQCTANLDFGKLSNIYSIDDLQLGKKIFDDDFNFENHNLLMISSGQVSPWFEKNIDGINYSIAYDSKTNKIIYIATQDSRFEVDGFKIGDLFKKFDDKLKVKLIREPGWSFFIKLPSGWNAAFFQGKSMTEEPLKENSKVYSFFKREY